MNNFHKPEDSVFNTGEIWYSSQDYEDRGVVILGKHRYDEGLYAVSIYYQDSQDDFSFVHDKDSWNFQVRYTHNSERYKQRNADDN